MRDVGFTHDAIQVVQNLYTDAKTKVRLPYTETDAISIDRGTIQGDTLSPFLFIIFLEPLLRWLQSGGRGYKYGCLQSDIDNKDHTTSALAYADDLAAITSTLEDLKVQAKKIESFSSWSGMKVNASKCAITGMLYQHASRRAEPLLSSKNIELLKVLTKEVKIQGAEIPFHHPE